MQEIINELNEIMAQIHTLHKQYNEEEENFNTSYEELDEENNHTPSYQLFQRALQIIEENGNNTLDYFKQCSLLDFSIIVNKSLRLYDDKDFYKQLREIWTNRQPKKYRYEDWISVIESLIDFEMMLDVDKNN